MIIENKPYELNEEDFKNDGKISINDLFWNRYTELNSKIPNQLKQMKWLEEFSETERATWIIELSDLVFDKEGNSISFSFDNDWSNKKYNEGHIIKDCFNSFGPL